MGKALGQVFGAGSAGGVGGFVGDITGTSEGIEQVAQASQGAALARQRSIDATGRLVRAESQEAIREAAPSVSELRALEGSIAGQERNIARQERLLQSIDPAILEASQQALALLRGEESKTLKPLREERQRQRAQLVNQLRAQLGPGAETSTAGIQALNQFDQQSSLGLAQAQQAGLQAVGQTAATFSGLSPQLGQSFATLAGLGQARGGVNQRLANTRLNALQPQLQVGLARADAAGARFVGQQVRGAGRIQQGQQLLQAAAGGAGAALGAG